MQATYENIRNAINGHTGCSLLTSEEREAVLESIGERDRVLEIGTFQGSTVSYWASRKPNACFLSVDNFAWVGDGTRKGNAAKWVENQCTPNMHLFIGTAQDLSQIVDRGHFDVVFIDGDHSYDGVRKDLLTAHAMLTPGGHIMGHDYMTDNPGQDGVTRAVNEFCEASGLAISKTVGSVFFI